LPNDARPGVGLFRFRPGCRTPKTRKGSRRRSRWPAISPFLDEKLSFVIFNTNILTIKAIKLYNIIKLDEGYITFG
jgi:hypothetical protein